MVTTWCWSQCWSGIGHQFQDMHGVAEELQPTAVAHHMTRRSTSEIMTDAGSASSREPAGG